jgi:hypothetical protein
MFRKKQFSASAAGVTGGTIPGVIGQVFSSSHPSTWGLAPFEFTSEFHERLRNFLLNVVEKLVPAQHAETDTAESTDTTTDTKLSTSEVVEVAYVH